MKLIDFDDLHRLLEEDVSLDPKGDRPFEAYGVDTNDLMTFVKIMAAKGMVVTVRENDSLYGAIRVSLLLGFELGLRVAHEAELRREAEK